MYTCAIDCWLILNFLFIWSSIINAIFIRLTSQKTLDPKIYGFPHIADCTYLFWLPNFHHIMQCLSFRKGVPSLLSEKLGAERWKFWGLMSFIMSNLLEIAFSLSCWISFSLWCLIEMAKPPTVWSLLQITFVMCKVD